jgi:polyhydroxyalkanoate synthesis regulator phasin
MRDKDAQLIFESYLNSKKNVVLEADGSEKSGWEQATDWLIFAGKVLDPTGISSYPDVIESAKKYEEDQSLLNFSILFLNFFSALPNLGLLAAGAGGIGWGALKAAARTAVKSGSKDQIGPIASKILDIVKGSPKLQQGFGIITDSLVKNGTMTQNGANSIMKTLKQGAVSTEKQRKDLEKALKSTSKSEFKDAARAAAKEEIADKSYINPLRLSVNNKTLETFQRLGRAGREGYQDKDELEYPKFLPQGIMTAKEGEKGPTKNAAAAGKRPSSKRVIKGQEKEQPKKTEQPKTEQPSAPKYAFDDI